MFQRILHVRLTRGEHIRWLDIHATATDRSTFSCSLTESIPAAQLEEMQRAYEATVLTAAAEGWQVEFQSLDMDAGIRVTSSWMGVRDVLPDERAAALQQALLHSRQRIRDLIDEIESGPPPLVISDALRALLDQVMTLEAHRAELKAVDPTGELFRKWGRLRTHLTRLGIGR